MKGAIKVIKRRKITTDIALPAAAVVVLLSVPLMATNSLHGYGQEVKTLRIGYFSKHRSCTGRNWLRKRRQQTLGNNVKDISI